MAVFSTAAYRGQRHDLRGRTPASREVVPVTVTSDTASPSPSSIAGSNYIQFSELQPKWGALLKFESCLIFKAS